MEAGARAARSARRPHSSDPRGTALEAPTVKHDFLKSQLQVGSAKSDKITFSLAQKVFPRAGDGPREREVMEAKRAVQKKKQPNILGTEPNEWNSTTIADQRIQKDVTKDLKRQLLKVRAGLMDEYRLKPSKMHNDETVTEMQKYVVSTTGKGPIGKLTGKWFNATDERGLSRHIIEEKWPDWNPSYSCHTKEDAKDAEKVFGRKEARRVRMGETHSKLDKSSYVGPTESISNLNCRLRERKVDFQELKEQFKRELKVEFPNASEERLQAMAQRLLNEKLLADEKTARFPVQHESFRPNLALTTQDRRYKEYSHPGHWGWSEAEQREAWSCCLSFAQDARGCECKVKNPDAWCTLGFERSVGVAATCGAH